MSGGLWIAAWLFTIRSLKFSFWQAVLAIVIWPYYLGAAFSSLVPSWRLSTCTVCCQSAITRVPWIYD